MKKQISLFVALLLMVLINQAQTITTGTITTPNCAGATVSVPFTVTGTYTSGNIFTAQLSDASGSFASPVNIGSATGVASGTIIAMIPQSTVAGTAYRIRVVSILPVITGSQNATALTINAVTYPNVSINSSQSTVNICSSTSITFTATPTNGGTAPVYTWKKNGFTVGTNSITYTNAAWGSNDTIVCLMATNTSCSLPSALWSNVIYLNTEMANSWTQKADIGFTQANGPSKRSAAVAFNIGNKGYIGSGYGNNEVLKDFWEYDPSKNTWTQRANIGGGIRYEAVGFSIGNKGYVGTGNANSSRVNDFWEYDPSTNIWTRKADFAGGARWKAVGFSIGSKGYIGMGQDDIDKTDFWEYDPINDTWLQKASLVSLGYGRVNAIGFSIGNKGYVGGGVEGSFVDNFWEFDPARNQWTQKASIGGGGRASAFCFSMGNKGYVGAGDNGFGPSDFWEYDPSSNIWTQKASFAGGTRYDAITFSIGNKAYAGTGSIYDTEQDLWEFDAISNTWSKKSNIGAYPRYSAVGFSIDSKGYVGGGTNGTTNVNKVDFWEYNSQNNTWTQKADIGGSGKEGAVGFSIGSNGYFGTGQLSDGSVTNDFWEYNPVLNTWTQKANFGGAARRSAVGFCIGNKGYIGTGSNNANDFWEYDPVTNTWTQKANFGGAARYEAVGFCIGNKGYLGTGILIGNNSSFCNDFWEYDPVTNTWTQKANFAGTTRSGAIGFSIGSKGYLGTGISGNGYKNDFWEYDPSTNTWAQKTNVGGFVRARAVGFSIGSKGFIGAGTNSGPGAMNDFWEFASTSLQSVSTSSVNTLLCQGSSVNVPYTVACSSFTSGNIFTAQLSDALGTFSNPANIGSVTATGSGSINATIPANTISGTNYRIRVIASNPSTIGTDNGTNIAIGASSSSNTSVSICANQLPYSWNGSNYQTAGTYTYTTTNAAGCDSVATLILTVNALPIVNAGSYPATTTASAAVALVGSPAGGVFSGTGVSANTFNPAVSGAGTFTITYSYTNPANGCSNTATTLIAVTQVVCNFSVATAITGNANVCANMGLGDSAVFSISAVNASSYAWSVSNATTMGMSPVRNGSSVKVKMASTFTTGTLTVTVTGCDGTVIVKSLALSKTVPGTLAGITGSGGAAAINYICPYIGGANVTYVATPPATNAASVIAYRWTLPTGSQLVSVNAADSSSITIKYPTTPTTLTLSVLAVSGCGNSAAKSITLNVTAPAAPAAITGLTDVCSAIGSGTQSATVAYSVAAVNNAASYLWTVPAGVTLVSGQGTTSVNLVFASSFVSGNITCQSISPCGNSTAKSLTVYKRVAAAPSTVAEEFSGTAVLVAAKTSVCGLSSATYRIRKVTYATTYLWRMKSGANVLLTNINPSGINDTAVIVNFLSGFTKDTLQVQALTACSVSTVKETAISAVNTPPTPSPISGSNTPCIGSVISYYAAAALPTATQSAVSVFRWTKPNNTTIVSANADSSNINLSYNTGFTGGTITVKGQSACGVAGTATSLVLQYLTPTPKSITSSTGVYNACIGTPVTFTAVVPAPTTTQRAAVVYRWTRPNNTTIVSASADSMSVTLQFNTGYTGGSLTVKGQTACGAQGTAKSQALTHTGCPAGTRNVPITKLQDASGNQKDVRVSVFPNPSHTFFNLSMKGANTLDKSSLKIMDLQGRLLDQILFQPNNKITFGSSLLPGAYMLELRVGGELKIFKVIKY